MIKWFGCTINPRYGNFVAQQNFTVILKIRPIGFRFYYSNNIGQLLIGTESDVKVSAIFGNMMIVHQSSDTRWCSMARWPPALVPTPRTQPLMPSALLIPPNLENEHLRGILPRSQKDSQLASCSPRAASDSTNCRDRKAEINSTKSCPWIPRLGRCDWINPHNGIIIGMDHVPLGHTRTLSPLSRRIINLLDIGVSFVLQAELDHLSYLAVCTPVLSNRVAFMLYPALYRICYVVAPVAVQVATLREHCILWNNLGTARALVGTGIGFLGWIRGHGHQGGAGYAVHN